MKSAYYASAFGSGGTGSRSRRAQIAESQGREPATRAAKTWGFKSASALRQWVPTNEWHHVGRYANAVEYFDVENWIAEGFDGDFAKLAGIGRDLTREGRQKVLMPLVARIVDENLDQSPDNSDSKWLSGYYHRGYPRPASREDAISRNATKRTAYFAKDRQTRQRCIAKSKGGK